MKVLCLDCETGGLDPIKNSVFSIGAIVGDVDTGEILESFGSLHRMNSIADYNYDQRAIEIHKITPQEAFEKGLSSTEIQNKLKELWTKHKVDIIGGHNFDFDQRMFSYQIFEIQPQEFEKLFTYRKLDTSPILRLFVGHNKTISGSSISQAAKDLEIDMSDFDGDFHNALVDAACTFRVLHKFRKLFMANDIFERLIQ